MLGKNNCGRIVLATCGIVLALGGCTATPDDDDSMTGSGGSAALPIVQASGGAPAASGGSAAPAGSGGVIGAAPTAGSGGASDPGDVVEGSGGVPAAGTGGVPSGSGGAIAEVPDGGMPPALVDYGEGDGSDVVTIGDSWMQILTNGGGIEGALDRAGTDYRHYGVPGTTLGGSIPGQYTDAKGRGEVATVIMTGGGNDIMFSGGCNTKEACEESVKQITMMLNELWTEMAADGVKDVFYIQYSKNVGTAPDENRPTMAGDPPAICLAGTIRCHSISTTDVVAAGDSIDGIHPTSAACDRIATLVVDALKTAGARR